MPELLARRRVRFGLPVVALAGLALTLVGLTYTSAFRARHLDVVGARSLTPGQVLRLAGLSEGTNVFHLDAGAIETALRASPWIADAKVERDLPSTIRITIVEREPVARVTVGGVPQVVAGDGTVLPDGAGDGLPMIRAEGNEIDANAWTDGARALSAMTRPIRDRIDDLVVQTDGSLTLRLADGVTVSYGAAADDDAKAASLRAILRWADEGRVTLSTIDLTVPDAPTATTVDGASVVP